MADIRIVLYCMQRLQYVHDGLPGRSGGATVDGGGITQLFNITGAVLHIENLLLSKGATNASGAAVLATGGATIVARDCAFSANTALEGAGGGGPHHICTLDLMRLSATQCR